MPNNKCVACRVDTSSAYRDNRIYLIQVDPKLTEQCVKNLVFIGRAMHLNPDLCFAESPSRSDTEEDEGDSDIAGAVDELEGGVREEDGEEGVEGAEKTESSNDADRGGNDRTMNAADPLTWVFNRMSHMVVHKGEARRRAVFSWFAAMIAVHESAVSVAHLRVILLPLRRAVLDAEAGGVEADAGVSSGTRGVGTSGQGGPGKEQTSAELATEVGCRRVSVVMTSCAERFSRFVVGSGTWYCIHARHPIRRGATSQDMLI